MIIWLASYPKSGNTWVRSFLSAYYYSDDGKFNFKLLNNIKQFPSRDFFNKKILSVEDASDNWLIAQSRIKSKGEVCFLKTHNVFGAYKGKNFTTSEFTLGAIYIVRDPRNVITSLMNHYSLNENEALSMINSVYRNLRDENNPEDYSNYSFISSWANNFRSWKLSKSIETLIIKYEDLENNRFRTFKKIINFTNKLMKLNNKIDFEKLKISIESTNFDILKKKEELEGFEEAIFSKKVGRTKTFFNLGSENNYKKLIKPQTSKTLKKLFKKEMKELGYI
tara:strand:- start:10142 stop:10981 length:840 start_codon:yes stop_codon:yes gene_type:complete